MEKLTQMFTNYSSPNSKASTSASQPQIVVNQNVEEYEEVECDLQQMLDHYKFHPLNSFFVSEITLLGKSEEFQIYQFFSNELEQHYILKIIGEESLYKVEKDILERLEGTKSTMKIVNAFSFEMPDSISNKKESQYYFIFDTYKHTLLQAIALK